MILERRYPIKKNFSYEEEVLQFLSNENNFSNFPFVELTFNFDVYNQEAIDLIKKCYDHVVKSNPSINIQIGTGDQFFSPEDFDNLSELVNLINNPIKFTDTSFSGVKTYNIEQIKEIYNIEDEILKTFEHPEISPFEYFLLVQNYVTSKKYAFEELERNKANNKINNSEIRALFSALTREDIVCVGYANLAKFFLGRGGISAYTIESSVYNKQDNKHRGDHLSLIVELNDDKYGIHGYFYFDPTWDAVTSMESHLKDLEVTNAPNLRYVHTLIPLKDINSFKKDKINFRPDSPSLSSIMNPEARINLCNEISECSTPEELISNIANPIIYPLYKECEIDFKIPQDRLLLIKAIKTLKSELKSRNLTIKSIDCNVLAELLALLMCNQQDKNRLNELFETLAKQPNANSQSLQISKLSSNLSTETISAELQDKIKFLYQKNNLINRLKSLYKEIEESKPISLESYKQGLIEKLIYQGWTKKEATKEAERIISINIKLSGYCFEDDATNCFSQENAKIKEREQ